MIYLNSFFLFLEFIIVACLFFRLYKKDIYCAIFFILIFYFYINFSIRYLYFPDSLYTRYIMGDFIDMNGTYWLKFNAFCFLSIITIYFVLYKFSFKPQKYYIKIKENNFKTRKIRSFFGTVFFILFTFLNATLFLYNYNNYSYANSLTNTNPLYGLSSFIILNSYMIITAAISLLFDRKFGNNFKRTLILFSVVLNTVIVILYFFKTGDRSTVLAIMIGLLIMMLYKKEVNLGSILKYILPVFAVYLIVMIAANYSRNLNNNFNLIFILFPTNMSGNVFDTFAVIKYDYVNPLAALSDIILKSIIRTSSPYLFQTLGELYANFELSGKYSFGHFLLCDGYVFCGMFGFLYNGIVIGFFVLLWRKIANTNDERFNLFVISLMSSMMLGMIRGAGMSVFIKYLYLYVLPGIVIYLYITGKKVIFCKKN